MYIENKYFDVNRLATSLRAIISMNRCSFSNHEIDQLEEIAILLEELKNVEDQKSEAFQKKLSKVGSVLLKVFSNEQVLNYLQEFLKDLFL